MTSLPKRVHLREMVKERNRSSRELTTEVRELGFLGWHERGFLPHCDFPGLVQFVTFRLADSMPRSRQAEWQPLVETEDPRERRTKLEAYLDLGHGQCWLKLPAIAGLAEQSLLHFQSQRYDVLAWCIMPNHVHVLVHVWQTPLNRVTKSWKQFVATHAEKILKHLPGAADESDDSEEPSRQRLRWQRECWDTYMRSEAQERTAIHYTEANPVKAGLCRAATEWPFSSARYRDSSNRLVLPVAGTEVGTPP